MLAAAVAAASLAATVLLTALAFRGTEELPGPAGEFGPAPAGSRHDPGDAAPGGPQPGSPETSQPGVDAPGPVGAPLPPDITRVDGTLVPGAAPSRPLPVAVTIPSIGVEAPVVPVGVDDGEMDIPRTAGEVAWYRYGPAPGEQGSAVLAAHVAWERRPGAFRDLVRLEPDAVIRVTYDDGTVRSFRVVALASYDKRSLPFDAVFARSGDPVLTLITCGGDFNPSLSSYEENVVAYAVPIPDRDEAPPAGAG
jgi:LPXTG-site transpeptidase (sortase) family protein